MPHVTASYTATLQRLFAYERTGMRLGLDGPRALHAAVGDPQTAFTAIQIAGTNGKGTTAACLDAILRAAGVRTGLYTSPHLIDFSERIRIQGRAIVPDDVERLMERLGPIATAHDASYFEIVTALAACAFAERGVTIAVTEVGLGGRLDATTVWPARLGAITSIDLDHMHILGDTLDAIAREKAGIAREGMTIVVAEERPGLQRVIEDDLRARGARCVLAGRDAAIDVRTVGAQGSTFDVRLPDGRALSGLATPLLGAHQARNAGIAVLLAALSGVDDRAIRDGLARVRWPGRAERIAPDVLVDVAHNPSAAERLAQTIRTITTGPRPVGLLGMLQDKDAAGVARALAPALAGIVATEPEWMRALPAHDLADAWRAAGGRVLSVEPRLAAAVADARTRAGASRTLLVVTGSCYTVGHALPHLGVRALDAI